MNTPRWIAGFVVIMASMAGCGQPQATQPSSPSVAKSAAPEGAALSSSLAQLPKSATELPTVPVPNLIPPTAATQRNSSEVGRSDPFASLEYTPVIKTRAASSITSQPVAPPISTASLPTVPVASLPSRDPATLTLPALPLSQPGSGNVSNLPSIDIAARPMAPVNLMESIEISGVVEAGGKTSVIVQEPNQSSRYVSVGDYLANGKILVKRVEMGPEPVVILEQDGKETSRYIGSTTAGLL